MKTKALPTGRLFSMAALLIVIIAVLLTRAAGAEERRKPCREIEMEDGGSDGI